jgi:hypothetical protein
MKNKMVVIVGMGWGTSGYFYFYLKNMLPLWPPILNSEPLCSLPKKSSEKFIFDRVKKYKITPKISAQLDHRCPSSKQLKLRVFKEGSLQYFLCYFQIFKSLFPKCSRSVKAETLHLCSELYSSQHQVFHSFGIFFTFLSNRV